MAQPVNSIMNDNGALLNSQIEQFLQQHSTRKGEADAKLSDLAGDFSLHAGADSYDLYGMIDAAYILFTIGQLAARTTRESRRVWAERILQCQESDGWFRRLNLRGHSVEHATAYAIGALTLLEIDEGEEYVARVQPLAAIRPLLTDRNVFEQWLKVLDFRPSPREILRKKLGWHYIWRGSHVGGGIPAALHMTRHLAQSWWPEDVDLVRWFQWYFEWLDQHASPQTGYWQRAFWNQIYTKPTLIDMGGAVHFYWIYDALNHPLAYPEQVVQSTLMLQRETGLYKDHPFCIDLDGNFCLLRAYLQLPQAKQTEYSDQVHTSLCRNYEAIVGALTTTPLHEIYNDSHGLPGALAALTECAKFPGFKYADDLAAWQHPLDKACWL